MTALLEITRPDLRARLDLVRGALDAHLSSAEGAPGRIGIAAALVAGAVWTVVAVASLGAPAPPDWPGYLVETLPLAVVGAGAVMVGALAAARPAWSANGLPLESGLLAVVLGHGFWIVVLGMAVVGGPYGAITAVGSAAAGISTAFLGLVLMRAGVHPIGEAVTAAGAVLLVPSPSAWLICGAIWTAIGLWRAADGRATGTGGIAGLMLRLVVMALVVAACGPTPSPSPSPGPATEPDVRIDLVAAGIAFQPGAVAVPSGTDFVVRLDNRDEGVPHNVALLADANFRTTLAKGEIVTGPAVVDLAIGGLIPGRYRLMCEVHPNMLVDLTVDP